MTEGKVIIERQGKTYEGTRSIEGTNRLFQTIYYGGHSKFDGSRYSPGQESVMEGNAKRLIYEILEEIEKTAK